MSSASAAASPSASTFPSLRQLWARAWSLSPEMTLSTPVMLLGAVLTFAGILLDPRQLVGEPLWLKPAKFYISVVAYQATLLYLFSFLAERRRLVRTTGAILSGAMALEMVAITVQAARGVRSHFNLATLFDEVLFRSMGVAIVVLWVTMLVVAVALVRAKLADRALASALRTGIAVGLLGTALGFFMTAPNPEQLAQMKAGQAPVEMGAHTFGAADGGAGLPLVDWSSTAGDMRPAHFLGLHGMQVLPVLALLLARRRTVSELRRLALVRAAGVGYAGLTLVLAIQALRHLPVTRWDATGLATVAAAAVAGFVAYAASQARRQEIAAIAA